MEVLKKKRASVMSSLWGLFLEDDEETYKHTVIVGLCFMESFPGIDAFRELVSVNMLSEGLPRYRSVVRMESNVAVMNEINKSEVDLDYVSTTNEDLKLTNSVARLVHVRGWKGGCCFG